MPDSPSEVLAKIEPTETVTVIDLVESAGIDILPWSFAADGQPVARPRSNPRYCYEWAFGGGSEPTLLFIWHESLSIESGHIVSRGEKLTRAVALEQIALDLGRPADVRTRSRSQATRCRRFDALLRAAWNSGSEVRVVLLGGDRNPGELGINAAAVNTRLLDESPWFVASYESDGGHYLLRRGDPLAGAPAPVEDAGLDPDFEFSDQFSLATTPARTEGADSHFFRSSEVRRAVLRRANGACELCGEPGFMTLQNKIYLETHHVVPLSDNGPDVVWNVVALCPNDHRRAHHGSDRQDCRDRLIKKLEVRFPGAGARLLAICP